MPDTFLIKGAQIQTLINEGERGPANMVVLWQIYSPVHCPWELPYNVMFVCINVFQMLHFYKIALKCFDYKMANIMTAVKSGNKGI